MMPAPMKHLALTLAVAGICATATAQISLSSGSYAQNFNTPTLSSQTAQGTNWNNNLTIPGWYGETSFGSITNYRVSSGGVNPGSLYSFGSGSGEDRALGSLSSSSYNGVTYGLRMVNDSATTIDALSISYAGEQWRNGAPSPAAFHSLAFSYRTDSGQITSPDWANIETWTAFNDLSFTGPISGGTAGGLDGNASDNRVLISATIHGLGLAPGQEMFIRWYDINDPSNDHGLAIDDLLITVVVPEPGTGMLVAAGLLLLLGRRTLTT
jgi:uncharacterized protein